MCKLNNNNKNSNNNILPTPIKLGIIVNNKPAVWQWPNRKKQPYIYIYIKNSNHANWYILSLEQFCQDLKSLCKLAHQLDFWKCSLRKNNIHMD